MKNEKNKVTSEVAMGDKEQANTHQQQILFDENDLVDGQFKEANKVNESVEQILFKNQDYIVADESEKLTSDLVNRDLIDDNVIVNKQRPRWLWRIALTLLAVVIGVETIDFFTYGFAQSPILTSVYAIILSCLLVLASSSLLSEWSSLRQFKRRQKLKQQAMQFLQQAELTNDQPSATMDIESFCHNITKNLPSDLVSEQDQAWKKALGGEHSPNEQLQLYSRLMLTKVDEKAMAEVAKFSTESVVLVALSPVALIDMLIMLWRNLRMINKIAGLYGLKLGYWSRIKLIRQVFVNMVYAGASELITDFGTDMIGADLLGKLSGRLAQGLGAGMLTARLGVKTMQLCRPIPFDDKPKLAHVRTEMLATIKGLMTKQG